MLSSNSKYTYDPIGPGFLDCLYQNLEIEFASVEALFLGPTTNTGKESSLLSKPYESDKIQKHLKCNVVGMAEQMSPGDHVVKMLQTWVPWLVSQH